MSGYIRRQIGDRTTSDHMEVERVDSFKGSVADLLSWCFERNVPPEKVMFTGQSHLSWPSVETDDERDARLKAVADSRSRQEEYERRTYERLRQKYEG